MIKWRVLTLIYINMHGITQERYSMLSIIVKSTRVFPVFNVGRNEHKFVICLKSDSHLPKMFFIISFNDSPSKMIKNIFYFI